MEQEDSTGNAGGSLDPNHFVSLCKADRAKRQHANPDPPSGGVTRSTASAGKRCRIRSDNVLLKRQNKEQKVERSENAEQVTQIEKVKKLNESEEATKTATETATNTSTNAAVEKEAKVETEKAK